MTPEEFKTRWDTEDGDGITFDDIAECAKEWGIASNPRCHKIDIIANKVTKFAKCKDIFPLERNGG